MEFIDNSIDNNIFDNKRNEIIREITKAILAQLGIGYKENKEASHKNQQATSGQILYRVMAGSYKVRENAEESKGSRF